jgi:hypothetical protein
LEKQGREAAQEEYGSSHATRAKAYAMRQDEGIDSLVIAFILTLIIYYLLR